jgi:hypothetical protein
MSEAWNDAASDEDLGIDRVTLDRFGVPSNLMGRHPQIGRDVAVGDSLLSAYVRPALSGRDTG